MGQDNTLTQPREIFLQDDSEEEDEPRPVRSRMPPRRYAEEDYTRQRPEREEVSENEEAELAAESARPRRQRRPVRRYIEEME